MEFLSQYAFLDLFWIGLSLFLIGMSKGGFPVGAIALPILILVWPAQAEAARAAVGFMLPMLCLMDVVALLFYWRHVQWGRIVYLLPAMITGVIVASYLFVSDEAALIAVSDRALKILIGGWVFYSWSTSRQKMDSSAYSCFGAKLVQRFGIRFCRGDYFNIGACRRPGNADVSLAPAA